MRAKEERLLDVIGDTKDRNVLAAVGHESADPNYKTEVHRVELMEVPKLPESYIKRCRIRNGILGGFAAAAVIAGGIVLWNSLPNKTIGTNPAQQSSTEPVVTIYQPGGSDDVSVTAEDRLSVITDLTMPEPFAPPDDPLVYDSADSWHDEFNDIWQKRFTSIDVELIQLIDNERAEDLLAQYQEAQRADIQAGNVTRYSIDDTANVYRFMKELGLSGEEMEDILKKHDEGLRKEISEGRNLEDHLFDLYTMYFGSENKSDMAATFKSPYAIVVGECVFSPRWMYYHTEDDYTEAGITATQVEIMMPLYEKLGLTDEAWAAFSAKLTGFIEENKKPEEKRRYIIDNSVDFQITSDEAIKILEDNFYGTWKRTPATGGDYDTLAFAYNYDYDERNLMGFDFDFEGFHRPFAVGSTNDIWYMECTSGGESEVFVIEKSEPKVMYCTGLIYYNGYDNSPAVDLSEDWVAKYEYEETLIDTTVRPGEISVLGQDKLFSIYGEDFERVLHENINSGLRGDYGRHYITGDDVMTAKSRRYLVSRGENSVTLGIRFYEQNEYEMYMNHEYPVGQEDGAEVSGDTDAPQPPTEYYFAVTFTRNESGEWSVSYGEFDDVYADYPEFTIYSIKDTPYVAEFEMHDLELRGSSLLYQGGVVRLVDGADHSVLGEAPISTGLVGLNGYVCGKDTTIDYNVLADGGVLISIMLATEGQWLVPLYYYNGEKLMRVSESSSGGIADFQVSAKDWLGIEDDKIYITTSDDYVTGYTIDNGVLTQISCEGPAYLSE